MTNPFTDKIALVTGASRGIGFATAVALAKAGAHVVALARTVGGLEELDDAVQAAGGTATLVPLDLADFDGIARLALALDERYGRLDILIANGSQLGPVSPLPHVEPKELEDLFKVNVLANHQLVRCLDPLLRRAPAGRVVFVSSSAAHAGRAYRGPYAMTKAALETLSRTYAAETVTTPVRVNAFNPGPTRTRMRAQLMPGEDPQTVQPPEEAAAAILPLCLPTFQETGRLFDVRAGRLLHYHPPN
ncbi:SDR family NAD(P)-dependent oxidoreductase [Rhodoplanes serenus]|uniref:SDR family NAD(P)-dependent oxidoreductase n=1 Tax=Rhodoplanes serenus TaxID=200615 RepID=A0A9X4XRI3_9BRAD|nr:SDR family NAD(P)-dependent oxidoreductase [Rhodoplanes serenus]MTW17291.1 SDR family NAD(P)-dependent oxidoreductase [Rhodoplanes serenus]